MKHFGDKVEDLNIAYIGGGSRGWAWKLMRDLAMEKSLCGEVRLYDIDKQAAMNNAKIGNNIQSDYSDATPWNYVCKETLKDALEGTDFVIISILPGTFDEMDSDVHLPEKYGIYQAVGDTTGPGGVVRAMRTIPMFVEIAEAIKKYCPNAWVINYTNPMSVCVNTLYKVFPQIKAFGCCHEVFGTQKVLLNMLQQAEGYKAAKRSDIKVNVLGINHFTWIDKAYYKLENLFPMYEKLSSQYYETGLELSDEEGSWETNNFKSCQRVKFDLFKRYGVMAAAGDRHLAEFCNGSWYLKNPETVKDWKFRLTTVDWRKKDLKERLEKAEQLMNGQEKLPMEETGEEGILQIKALLGLGELLTNVNTPNVGQIPNIPLGVVVETNAHFSEAGVVLVMAGKVPDNVYGIMAQSVQNQIVVTEAGLKKDLGLAFTAFVNDPLVHISLGDSKKLFKDMIHNTSKYLEGFHF